MPNLNKRPAPGSSIARVGVDLLAYRELRARELLWILRASGTSVYLAAVLSAL
jgi:hypothetical protein